MDFTKLKIEDIFKQNDNIIIGATFRDIETKEAAIEESKSFFVDMFNNKRLRVTNGDHITAVGVVDVVVTSNIIGYKSFYFLTDLKEVPKIKLNDLAEVIDNDPWPYR